MISSWSVSLENPNTIVKNMFTTKNAAAVAAKSLQSCPTLCDPMDCSLPGFSVHGILQTRTLEWLPIPSPMHESEKWKWSRSVVSDSLWPHGLQPTRLLCPWDFPGKSTGVGCHCILWQPKIRFSKMEAESSKKSSLRKRTRHMLLKQVKDM